jgi:hypothetical protein
MGRAPGKKQGEKDASQNDSNNSHVIPFRVRFFLFVYQFLPFMMGLAKSAGNVYKNK